MGMETKPTEPGGGGGQGPGPPLAGPPGTPPPLTREQMRELYRKVAARDPAARARQKSRNYLQMQVVQFLSTVEHSAKLCRPVSDTLDRSVREVADYDPEEGAEAFLAVERYALNVLNHPWKSEFKVVKLYTGFFCGRIAPHLKGATDLFKMMGYEQLDSTRLVLKRATSHDNLLYVACECYIAAMECMLMTRILERVEVVNYVISDVYRARRECRGDVDMSVLWITDNCEPSRTSPRRHHGEVEKAEHERQEKENRRYEVGFRPRHDRDRRWEQCDDRLSPVHAYGFGYQNRHLALGHTNYDSMGRPVRQLHTEATQVIPHAAHPAVTMARKDTGAGPDSGITSMEVPACARRVGLSRSNNSNSAYDPVRFARDEGNMLDILEGDFSDLPESASDYDLYAAGTIDDHLQRSLLYIQRLESGPKSLKEAEPTNAPLKDDWGDVRENLRCKYGDKYFEGERGDILKTQPDKDELSDVDTESQPPPYKAVVEATTKQRYDNVLQEISGKLTSRRAPTPSSPSSASHRSPPLTHRSSPSSSQPANQPPPSPAGSTRAGPSSSSLDTARRMPSILENTSHLQASIATDCPTDSGSFLPPPPSDLHSAPLGSLEEVEEVEEGAEDDDDMPPPPPESLDGVKGDVDDDAGARLEDGVTDDPLVNLGLSFCRTGRKETGYDDARFNKPRFQSFGMEDGEFLLKRERGPSPPPRLLPRGNNGGKPNGPVYRPERRSFYDNVDNDSNMSSPLGTSSTFSSSADTVVAAAERLTACPSQASPAANTSSASPESASPAILRKHLEVEELLLANDVNTPMRRLNVKSASYEEQRQADERPADPHRPKSVGFGAEDSGSGAKWQCDTCTFKNALSVSVCEICGRSRDLGPDLEPVSGAGPQCLYCTLVNTKGTRLCDACGADLEGCATYI